MAQSECDFTDSFDKRRSYHFFSMVHKSIVSADFYRAVSYFPLRTVLSFAFTMCLVSALVSGVAFTYYALDRQRGLPALIPSLFPSMSLKGGVLDPGRATPWVPDKVTVTKAVNLLSCIPGAIASLPDSLLLIDTSQWALEKLVQGRILFSRRCIAIRSRSTVPVRVSYCQIVPKSDTIVFTSDAVAQRLSKHVLTLYLNFFLILSGIIATVMLWLSIIFLTVAAYVFRIQKQEKLNAYFRKACFAVSPVFLGNNLIALSGTHVPNAWYVLLMISVFIMFRSVRRDHQSR